MGSVDERVGGQFRCLIERTQVFGATSPSAAEGHVNVSPTGIDGLPAFDPDPSPPGEAVVATDTLDSERAASPSATDRELGATPRGRSALDVKCRPDQVLLPRQEKRQQP